MTISTEAAPLSYNGDGSTISFAITWKYFAKADVVVTHRDTAGAETTWVLGTQYTLSDAGVSTGGTLTVVIAPTDYTPATGEKLVIELEPANTQDSSIPLGGPFPSTVVEEELDVAAQRDAKLQAKIDLGIHVPKSDTQTGSLLELPIDTDRASMAFHFDANGKPSMVSTSGSVSTGVTAYIATLMDDANSATARATLEIETSETATGTFTLDPDILTSYLDSTAGAVTATLGARTVPGLKLIVMNNATATSTVSVTNAVTGNPELHTFTALDDSLLLMWTGRVWVTITS